MKQIKICKICGRLYATYNNAVICKHCLREDEKVSKAVREYIDEHPGVRLNELCVRFDINPDYMKFNTQKRSPSY